jgi:molybdopterin molybdotransferase
VRFERIAVLDWSAAARPKRGRDSIWLGLVECRAGAVPGHSAENIPTRVEAVARLRALIAESLASGNRLLIGADFSFGFPAGFARAITGRAEALAVWEHLAKRITDTPANKSNYRDVAAEMNRCLPGAGPFWGNGSKTEVADLPRLRPDPPAGIADFRQTEIAGRGGGGAPKSVWQLAGAGAVGAQSLTGIAALQRLRAEFGAKIAVWPFEAPDAPVFLAEVYPGLMSAEVKAFAATTPGMTTDEAQVRVLSMALATLNAGAGLGALLTPPAAPDILREEGWILGAGQTIALRAAAPAAIAPPRLQDDCFAMPRGVQWVPVDEALARLRAALRPVIGTETVKTAQAAGRVLAADVAARRANPPRANSAVDGYGFAHAATGAGPQRLPLVAGRAAAGRPFEGMVPFGAAVRILTGAILPEGVDCVVLEEDTASDGAAIVFDGPVRPGANTRAAGEDVAEGATALPRDRRLRAPDLALLSALGVAEAPVRRRLRVAVLSTGDEIVPDPARAAAPHQIYDANRPMLLSLIAGWDYVPVDLGHVRDDPRRIAAALDRGAGWADVILTSGGASAGEEDHVSRLLRTRGALSSWRIAMKPGRPLALALWQGTPVIGLPGNPVAALVCALIFGRPALSLLAGAGWREPQGYAAPAAFSKRKKAGRREYLRARLNARGEAEVFASEGSGRISGLSWAEGLVELPDGAMEVTPGTMVRYLPYAGFGLL